MAGKVTVIAYHRAKPGQEQALRDALLAVCAPTRAEKGCLNYDLHVSPDDPGMLVFHENWESRRISMPISPRRKSMRSGRWRPTCWPSRRTSGCGPR
jgi:Antibiotic biosynthesis monooxygenase